MQRYGDWNAKNRELLAETQALGGNKYREIYQRIKNNMELGNNGEEVQENNDTLNEVEVKADLPGFEGTWEALENITIKPR
jgi:hypothetical protein